MRTLLIILLAFLATAARAADAGRPIGPNCNLPTPPKDAGEEFEHGVTLKIYPRIAQMPKNYTGCQTMWAPGAQNWQIESVVAIERGYAVRLWSPDESDRAALACRYQEGKVVSGNAEQCPVPESLILRSVPPGCMEQIVQAEGNFPAGCGYDGVDR
jgi:hypothetical protein